MTSFLNDLMAGTDCDATSRSRPCTEWRTQAPRLAFRKFAKSWPGYPRMDVPTDKDKHLSVLVARATYSQTPFERLSKDGYAFARAVMRAHHSVDIRLPMKRIAAQHMQAGGAVFEQRTKTFTLLLESLRALGVKPLFVDAFGLSQGNLVRRLEEGPAAGPAATPPELPLLLVQAASRCAGRPAFRMLKRDRAAQRDRSDCRLHRLQRTLACSH